MRTRGAAATNGQMDTLDAALSTVEPAHTARIKKLDTVHSAAMCSTHSVVCTSGLAEQDNSKNNTTERSDDA